MEVEAGVDGRGLSNGSMIFFADSSGLGRILRESIVTAGCL